MSEWKECTLGDVLVLRRGYDLTNEQQEEGDIPVACSNGPRGFHNVETKISPCITVGRSGSIGNVYYYERCWAHNTTLYVEDFKGNDPKFLYYLLKSLPISNIGGGSAVPSLNRNHVHPMKIKFPNDLPTQQRIASILSSLDAKIENNNKINAKLEEIAQNLFKEWFVDFGPFKNGKFVESELGLIPEGWRVGTFSDTVDIMPGGTPKTDINEFWDNGDIPFFSPKDAGTNIYCLSTEKAITSAGLNSCSSRLYPRNTIFITARGTVGKVVMAACDMAMNQSNYALKPKNNNYYYTFLLTRSITEKLKHKSNGAVFSAITTRDFDEKIIIPNIEIENKFNDIVNSLFSEIWNLQQENQRLATLRDTLLPKLMSGEIEV